MPSVNKEKFDVKGKGPKGYFTTVGRFMVIDGNGEEKFFYEFHKAYSFYLQCSSATIIDAQTEELIEQKVLRQQVYQQHA